MHPSNTDLFTFDIEILRHAKVSLTPAWKNTNARNYYTRLYFIQSGKGHLQCGGKEIPLEAGNIYLIPSECRFGFGCETLDKIFFHIMLPAKEKTDILSEIGTILILHDRQDIIDALYRSYGQTDPISLLRVKNLLYLTLEQFFSVHDIQFSCSQALSKLSSDALRYIWGHISVKLSVQDVAQQLYVSESKLRNTFKNDTGIALGKYIDDAVFFTVRKMLTAGVPIEQITVRLGFCDRNYLSRRFKEQFGKTISQYRKDLYI